VNNEEQQNQVKKIPQANSIRHNEINSELLAKLEAQNDAIIEALVKSGMTRAQAEEQRKSFS
jgi:hypothetical protein